MSQEPQTGRPGLVASTLWSWAAVAANVAMGFVATPLLIARLGDEAYGLWVLVFSLVDYFVLFDFGLRSAIIKFVAQHWTLAEAEELPRTINSAFAILLVASVILGVGAVVVAPRSPDIFDISPALRSTFQYVVLTVGLTWSVSFLFMPFAACLEAVQRFDLSNRIQIGTNLARVIMVLLLLLTGHGLTAVVTAVAIARLLQCGLLFRAFGREFRGFRWGLAAVDRATIKKLAAFGVYNIPANIGGLLIYQGPPVVIGMVLPERFVGYYALPIRLLQSVQDLVGRVAMVTTAWASEMVARQQRDELVRLGLYANRYGLLVFLPAAVFLLTYGDTVFAIWFTRRSAEFAAMSSLLLPLFVFGVLLSDASQVSSGSLLYGLARHQVLTIALLVEGCLVVMIVRHFAIQGDLWWAAASTALLAVANRGLLTPWMLCRELRIPLRRYFAAIAVRPLLTGAVAGLLMAACRATWLPGVTSAQLFAAAGLTSAVVVAGAGRYCLFPEHRERVVEFVRRRAPGLGGVTRVWLRGRGEDRG